MQINVTTKGVTASPEFKDLVERRIKKLERLLRQIDAVDVTCSRERQWHVVEIVLDAGGLLVRGEDRAADFPSAVENLFDKLERRIKKSRSKMIQHYREAPETSEAWATLEEELPEESREESHPTLVRSKRFAVKPMSPEEAAAQMELVGHDFYVFTNAETEQVNVIYRRKDGNYGLIEPEF